MGDENEETVWQQSPLVPDPAGTPAAPQAPAEPFGEPTAGAGFGSAPAPDFVAPPFAPLPPASPPPPPAPLPPIEAGAPRSGVGIKAGDVLNHMFEVTRFLARGGMGEVFEGVNITNGEKVAIKVILPSLSADPDVIAMFRKEASALTRLSHQALVRYRVQAQEPTLGCFYIVTGYIDGMSLSDAMGKLTPSLEELVGLTRRLAEGLKEAHDLGVIHRDISPDNVLLEADRLDRARIIDFGIAKETDPGAQTIIGTGFAGKLSYVAPEQLGDFDKEIGPWSDVYSLGLVILALAQGRKADLGGLPVEAMNKRRAGVDTSGAPAALRPVLDKMLVADPAKRFRSMDDVIAALGRIGGGMKLGGDGLNLPPRKVLIGGGIAAGVLLIGGLIAFATGGDAPAPAPVPMATQRTATLADIDRAVKSALPGLPCSWIDVAAQQGPGGVTLKGTGVAGTPTSAETAIFNALRGIGANVAATDFAGVAPIDASFCPLLDELRQYRPEGATRITTKQPVYEIGILTEGSQIGKKGARMIVDLALSGLQGEFALYGIEKSNQISPIVGSRADFMAAAASSDSGIARLEGIDNFRLELDISATPGWAGVLLLIGKGGFTEQAIKDLGTPAGNTRFDQAAAANGWKAEIVWFKFTDNVPDAPAPAGSAAPATP